MSRRKGSSIDAPSTEAEAIALATLYGQGATRQAVIKALADEQIATIKADAEAKIADIEIVQKQRFAELKAWWAVAKGETAKGKRSIEIGGVTLGERMTTPKLGFLNKMKELEALAWLLVPRWPGASKFVRVKRELDKPAILKALGGTNEADAAHLKLTFASKQKDEFFIAVGQPEAVKIEDDAA